MSDLAIRLRDVSKTYAQYARPVDRLLGLLAGKEPQRVFQALRGVNLDVHRGETVGLVGRNGSGKSTLLQIVAGTLTPTTGSAEISGRISALLELGSGFNPEFTGRENVIFQGRLQGFDRRQMEQRFDQITAFADIGNFIEQPVKTYSSGMYVRLAFSVAVSTDPDILIVDEALAVGDEAFQRKCYARLREIQDRGGTILFVSHSANAIIELCDRAVLLDRGEMLLNGVPKRVTTKYHQMLFAPPDRLSEVRAEIVRTATEEAAADAQAVADAQHQQQAAEEKAKAAPDTLQLKPQAKRPAAASPDERDHYDANMVPQSTVVYTPHGAQISDIRITRPDGTPANVLVARREYVYSYRTHFTAEARFVRFGMLIKTLSGVELAGCVSHPPTETIPHIPAGSTLDVRFRFRCLFPTGAYFVNAGVSHFAEGPETYLHRVVDAVMFRVQRRLESTATGLADIEISAEIAPAAGGSTAAPAAEPASAPGA